MTYRILTTPKFEKAFKKLDRYTQRIIKVWIDKHLMNCEDPRQYGKGLTSNRSGEWRYRIGDYRLLCEIRDEDIVIIMINIGHRRDIYDSY
ncbi:MAG: type II toxin-antitoxin system RelE/ParE family toxin [Lachnospiraceae bacterium]|nr:type II toxin-antitoxin system RelE/ParE family toxin [Lachnospiraceae bacterium]